MFSVCRSALPLRGLPDAGGACLMMRLPSRSRGKRSTVSRPRPPQQSAPRAPKRWDEEFWENYQAPKYLQNRYVWVAAAALCVGLAWYSANLGR